MGSIPRKEFSQTDPDDEIDLESLVKKTPPPQPSQKKETVQPSVLPPVQAKPVSTPAPDEEFDLTSFPKTQAARLDAASPKPQAPAASVAQVRKEPAAGRASDTETEFDHPIQRKRVKILPSFPTLILIIIVSAVAAVLTGSILKLTTPSLQNKMQEILSNQENNSVKVNTMEQTVAKLVEDMKLLQDKAKPHQAAPASAKKHKPKAQPAPDNTPAPEGTPSE